jgi:hypothetical protein
MVAAVLRHARAWSGRPRRSASAAPRSAATQHITFDVV